MRLNNPSRCIEESHVMHSMQLNHPSRCIEESHVMRSMQLNHPSRCIEESHVTHSVHLNHPSRCIGRYSSRQWTRKHECFDVMTIRTLLVMTHSTTDYTSFMLDPITNSMFIEPVTSNSIIAATCKLITKSSCGHDDISSK